MKSYLNIRRTELLLYGWAVMIFPTVTTGLSAAPKEAVPNVVIWDAGSRFSNRIDIVDRTDWKAVPTDLLTLETDPSKASSDPGYYGRKYAFGGDAVIENSFLTAVLWSKTGSVIVFSKTNPDNPFMAISPLLMKKKPTGISQCEILRNTGDEAALEISFSATGVPDVSAVLSLGKDEIVAFKPARRQMGIRLLSPIEYGIVPSFIGDDLIYGHGRYPSGNTLCLPAKNLFLGLLKGENRVLVLTWPEGKQQIRLGLGKQGQADQFIESIDFDTDGRSLYLALLEKPGIWHREELTLSFLERDVAIDWKRPFPAKWITQLYEGEGITTYAFRETKGPIWRGAAGRYNYPVWFDGDQAFYHLSKKAPPKGESLVYFLEGKNTPVSISTPVDIMKATLGRQSCDKIFDFSGQRLRTHHRRGAAGIRRACTCGCTEAIEAVFQAGQEINRREYIEGAVKDMRYFVKCHLQRIDEYRDFAGDMIKFLRASARTSSEEKPFLDSLTETAEQILQEYEAQKENLKSLEYADVLAGKTTALTLRKSPQNLTTCLELCKEWRGMGGAQDSLLAQFHILTRQLFQEAGYGCANLPQAMALAQEVRRRCRECLRNPDGYEIWPNY